MEKITKEQVAKAMETIRMRCYQDSLETTVEELERRTVRTLETITKVLSDTGLLYPGTLSNLAFDLVFNTAALNAKRMQL